MKSLDSSRIVILFFVTGLVILVGAMILTGRSIIDLIAVDRLYIARSTALISLEEIKSTMLSTVITERNYIFTADDKELQAYAAAKAGVWTAFEALEPMIDDSSAEQVKLNELRALFTEKFAALDAMNEARKEHGNGPEVRNILVQRSMLLLDRIDATAEDLQSGEKALLQQLEGRSAASAYLSLSVSTAGILLALLLLVVAFVVLEREIMRRRAAEAGLLQARDLAEAANRAKSEFLANISHEIRTPMNAIMGFAELLEGSAAAGTRQRSHLEGIKTGGRNLLTLINDILDLSKIEAGRLEIRLEPVALRSVVHDVEQIFTADAARKGLALQVVLPADIPELLLLDAVRLRQVLFNLVGNAVKFTDAGSITVAFSLVGEDPEGTCVALAIEVRDTGIGIPEADLAAVFEPFRQAEHAGRRSVGTGLGLTISRRLVELMGGTLAVKSDPGKGSLFRVTLPRVRVSDAPLDASVRSDSAPGGEQAAPADRAAVPSSAGRTIARFLERARRGSPLPEAMRSSMRVDILPAYDRLKLTLAVNDLRAWCARLEEGARVWGCPELGDYARALVASVDAFQIAAVVEALEEFQPVEKEFST